MVRAFAEYLVVMDQIWKDNRKIMGIHMVQFLTCTDLQRTFRDINTLQRLMQMRRDVTGFPLVYFQIIFYIFI